MKRRAKIDANQPEIVAYLRAAGASVLHLHQIGGGCPDLAVGYRGRTVLVEIKSGDGAPNEEQLRFHAAWRGGAVRVVWDLEDAQAMLSKINRET